MSTTITLPDPSPVKQRGRDGRKFEVEYDLGVDENGAHHYAVFECYHNKGGINYFNGSREPNCYQAAVRHETAEPPPPGSSLEPLRGWTLGDGVVIDREPIGRYNAAKLRAFFDRQLAQLPQTLAEKPRIARFFEQRGAER